MVFEAVDRNSYYQYLRVFQYQLGLTALDILHTTRRACFMGVAVNRNNRAMPHKDMTDFRDGWAVMCCFGDLDGGELCLSNVASEGWRKH